MLPRLFPLYLCLALVNALQVIQSLRQPVNSDGTTNFTCKYVTGQGDNVSVELWRKTHNDRLPCERSFNDTQVGLQCVISEEKQLFIFTIFNFVPNDTDLYFCRIYRKIPLPIVQKDGNGTILFFPETAEKPTPACQGSSILQWILLGSTVLFVFYSMIVTCAYLKLKVQEQTQILLLPCEPSRPQVSQNIEIGRSHPHTSAQIPPRPNHKKKRRRGDESNGDYMDMRQVPKSRDKNFNSQQIHY
ncbi:T-cell-specific surface glycoprotein CD28 [Amia ocellicauda]|uniref:T-cell-specific surface glycoprotein CD28 n=1 Tax=Amia ocellicauda TaxID=2972642 RepID=UPI003464727B